MSSAAKKAWRTRRKTSRRLKNRVAKWLRKHPRLEFLAGFGIYNLPDPVPGPVPGATDPVALPMMADGARRIAKENKGKGKKKKRKKSS